MSFCANCGNKLSQDDKFCEKCGKSQTDDFHKSQETKYEFIKTGSTETQLGTVTNYEYHGNKNEYILNVIKKKSLNRLKLGIVLLCIGIILCFIEINYIQNIFSGPREVNIVDLENELTTGKLTDLNINLDLNKDNTFDSGYYYYTQETDTSTNEKKPEVVTKKYYLTLINKHLLILEIVPKSNIYGKFSGALKPIDADLRSKIITDFEEALSEYKGIGNNIVLPYILTDSGITSLDDIWVVVISMILISWGGYRILKWIKDPNDKNHYIKLICTNVGYENMSTLSSDFVDSFKSGIIRLGSYNISNKFISKEGTFKYEVYPLSQLYWIYKKVTSHSVNFVPTGKSYGVVLQFKPHLELNIGCGDQTSIQYLTVVYTLCPWVKVGYPWGANEANSPNVKTPVQPDQLPKCPKCGREYAKSRLKCTYCGVDLV